jgi:hypothetical protein
MRIVNGLSSAAKTQGGQLAGALGRGTFTATMAPEEQPYAIEIRGAPGTTGSPTYQVLPPSQQETQP